MGNWGENEKNKNINNILSHINKKSSSKDLLHAMSLKDFTDISSL